MAKLRLARILLGPLVLTGMFATTVAAQTNEEIFSQFQWNFSSPGARANAMGQAFIGVADDASSTVTNPGGLLQLTRPQVYIEFKSNNLKVDRFATRNSLIDAAAGNPDPTTFGGTINSLSFFDVAAPIGSRVAVGLTRWEFLNYQESFQLAPRPIPNYPDSTTFLFPVDATSDFSGVSYAGTVAVALTDKLGLGLTVSQNRLSATSRITRTGFPEVGIPSDVVTAESRISGGDTAFGWSLGALARPTEAFSVGVLPSKGPKFHVQEDFQFNPSTVTNLPLVSYPGFPTQITIHVPDRLGLGVGVRPIPRLLVSADVVRVTYSNLAKDFTLVLQAPTLQPSSFTVDDVVETHLGSEWAVLTGANSVFVRAGVYTDPFHGIKFTGTSDPRLNAVYNALFNLENRDTSIIGTFGGGVAVGRHFQADLAYVWDRDLVVSAAYRF